MTRPSWRLGTLILALLLVGAAVGYALATVRYLHGHEHRSPARRDHADLIERLDRELHFTPQQRERIQSILDRKAQELKERRWAARRELKESREETRREIETLLDERQQKHYRVMFERMRARWGRRDSLDQGR